jgi:hypothetical protein
MEEALLMKKLDEGYYEEALQYFDTERKNDIVIDEMKDLFAKYNNKYASVKNTNKLRRYMWDLNRVERKRKKKCPYCKKEYLLSNYSKHFKSNTHILKFGVLTYP